MRQVEEPWAVADSEFFARVRRSPATGDFELAYACGQGISFEDKGLLLHHLCEDRQPALQLLSQEPGDSEREPAFADSWTERGYDLSTLRFSIRHLQGASKRYPPVRRLRLRPGVLFVRWGCLEYDRTGDIITSWHQPCSKGDSNHFHSWLSMPLARTAQMPVQRNTLLGLLEKQGFDVPSLTFEIHHLGRKAELSALAKKRRAASALCIATPPSAARPSHPE